MANPRYWERDWNNDMNKPTLNKIQKLLKMAGDVSSPNEALLAAKRARTLMDKHQITKEDIESVTGDQFLQSEADIRTYNRKKWLVNLWVSASDINDCVAVISSAPDVRYKFQGFKLDAVVAKLTMDYFVDACNSACEQSLSRSTSEKNFFKLGFSEAIMRKARAIKLERERNKEFTNSTGTSLVIVKKKLIEQHFGELELMKSHKIRNPSSSEIIAYRDGIETGERLSMDKQVNGSESAKLN